MGEITEMIREFHGNSVVKGFYLDVDILLANDKLTEYQKKFIKDTVISQRLALIMSELGEALEAVRNDHYARLSKFNDMKEVYAKQLKQDWNHKDEAVKSSFEDYVKNSLEDELADTVIRVFDLAGWLKIDLEQHIALKHQYNLTRPFLHGKRF